MSSYQSDLINAIFSEEESSSSALNVYQNNYIENALNALSIEFPTVKHLLGVENFRAMMKSYIAAFPKSEFNWSTFGQHMQAFLLDNESLADMPYLLEVASLDWQFREIEKLKDVPFDASSFELMQTYPAEELRFKVAAGFQLFEAFFPIDLFIQLPSHEDTDHHAELLKNIKKAMQAAINFSHPRSFLLWRREYQPCIKALNEEQRTAFQQLANNASVEDVLASAGENAEDIGAWLQAAIQAQQICAVELL